MSWDVLNINDVCLVFLFLEFVTTEVRREQRFTEGSLWVCLKMNSFDIEERVLFPFEKQFYGRGEKMAIKKAACG